MDARDHHGGRTHAHSPGAVVLLILLCHKFLARFDAAFVCVELLAQGGGGWLFHPHRAAVNRASLPMSRRLARPSAMPIAGIAKLMLSGRNDMAGPNWR